MHFAHSRAALGALVADDDHVAFLDLIAGNRVAGVLHGMEYPGAPCKLVHGRLYAGFFHHSPVRRQAAIENGDAALLIFGLAYGENHIVFHQRDILYVFQHRFAGDGHVAGLQLRLNGFKNGRNASVFVEHGKRIFSRRLQVAYVGNLPADFVEIGE